MTKSLADRAQELEDILKEGLTYTRSGVLYEDTDGIEYMSSMYCDFRAWRRKARAILDPDFSKMRHAHYDDVSCKEAGYKGHR